MVIVEEAGGQVTGYDGGLKTTLVSSGEDVKNTLVSSGEDVKNTLVSSGEDAAFRSIRSSQSEDFVHGFETIDRGSQCTFNGCRHVAVSLEEHFASFTLGTSVNLHLPHSKRV